MDQIIGIDCATEKARTGLARGILSGGTLRILDATVGSKKEPPVATITHWIEGHKGRTLLAIDAPLGWPEAMGRLLSVHHAGAAIAEARSRLFHRETDRFIQDTLRKRPLAIGADRIAHTAHAALQLLGELAKPEWIGRPVTLVWKPAFAETIGVIEVYPAATLVGHGIRDEGYKGRDRENERREIAKRLNELGTFSRKLSLTMRAHADALDAAVCVIAGFDFLTGRAMPPTNPQRAAIEGWIWATRPLNDSGARRPD